MDCPCCGTQMREGKVAANGRFLSMAEVVWEPLERERRESKRVLWPGPLGLRTRSARFCDSCEALVIEPNQSAA
jgi:hypothetical protein